MLKIWISVDCGTRILIQVLNVKNILSEPTEITQGVHRGSVLSPLLFNIFINDIADDLTVNGVPFLPRSKISH